MNSRRNAVTLVARILFALLVVFGALALLSRVRSGPVEAQSTQTPQTRRLFENRVPEHLPIKVKIKREKEKAFRDLNNDNWARDFEIEVKNVGEKPIYFLHFALLVPDAKIADSYQAFTIIYGRVALADLNNRPMADDVPIGSGETKILRIEDVGLLGWDEARAAGLVPRRIRGAKLMIQDLNFGDGTGFEGTSGAPRPKVEKPKARACLGDDYGGAAERGSPIDGSPNVTSDFDAGVFQPASFLRAEIDERFSSGGHKKCSA